MTTPPIGTTFVFAVLLGTALPAMAQSDQPVPMSGKIRAVESESKPVPRLADGKPDLQGVWQARGVSLDGVLKNLPPPEPAPYNRICLPK